MRYPVLPGLVLPVLVPCALPMSPFSPPPTKDDETSTMTGELVDDKMSKARESRESRGQAEQQLGPTRQVQGTSHRLQSGKSSRPSCAPPLLRHPDPEQLSSPLGPRRTADGAGRHIISIRR